MLSKYPVPLIHVSDSLDGATLDAFTPPFIVNPNHVSGVTLPVRIGSAVEAAGVAEVIADYLRVPSGIPDVQWAYWKIKPRVIVERLLVDDRGDLPDDFKFHCFGGKAHFIQVDTDRFTPHRRSTCFDREWSKLPLSRSGIHPARTVSRPDNLEAMIRVAQALASGLDYEGKPCDGWASGVMFLVGPGG